MTDTSVTAGQTSTGITVSDGDTLTVLAGGTVSNTTVNDAGTETVDAGGRSISTTVSGGGTMNVNAGGSATFTKVTGVDAVENVSGGTTTSTTVIDGGLESVVAGGTVSNTTLGGLGTEYISGGTAIGTQVNNGGSELVDAGGKTSGAVLNDQGQEYVSAGGSAISTTINTGGTLNVYPGGTAIGTIFAGGQEIDEAACYAAGTRIATARGDISVEHLTVGELVRTHGGEMTPIKWLGHRWVDGRRHPRPSDVWPVRVRAGAFALGRPRRDVVMSPDHSVFVEDALIPIRYLINGATVVQEQVDRVSYWHVELHRHGVILAEGLPAESYLDTGNRGAFANGGTAVHMHPDFAMKVWEARACAPMVMSGPARETAHAALLARLPGLGYSVTEDPALQFRADDGEPLAAQTFGDWLCVALPEAATTLRIVSRQFAPAELDPANTDRRRLGVALTHLRLDHERLALDHPRFLGGWQACETKLRWTDGAGVLRFTPGSARYAVPPAATGVTVGATRFAGR
jgi:autotransporter passenger strand-loop-strand repeat protein